MAAQRRAMTLIVGGRTDSSGSDYLAGYLAEQRVLTRSPRTVKSRRSQIGTWLRWLSTRGIGLRDATRGSIITFLSQYECPATRAAYRAALCSFHTWLVDSGLAPGNPTRHLPPVRVPDRRPHPIPDALIAEAMVRATPAERKMLILGRFAGLRAAEIAAAHRDYLTGDAGREVVQLVGKGDKWRELPAHPLVVDVLSQADGWVFPSPVRPGCPIVPGRVTQHMSALLPDDWTAHSLRHRFGTDAYARTRDLRVVQEWMGHSDPATTAGYVEVDHDWQAIASMNLSS